MAARNDGYEGNFLNRMQRSLDSFFRLAKSSKLNAELIIVEWNPPADRLGLVDALNWGNASIPCRVIRVPSRIHGLYQGETQFGLFEYLAKNTGIRRAKGEFVLITNPDIVFSAEMVQRLTDGSFDSDHFYLAARHNLDVDGKETSVWDAPPEGLIHYMASGDFTLMSRIRWEEMKGYPEVAHNMHVDSHALYYAQRMGLSQVVLSEPIYHQFHAHEDRIRQEASTAPANFPAQGEDWYTLNTHSDWGFQNNPEIGETQI